MTALLRRMHAITSSSPAVPLFGVAASRRIEQDALAATPPHQLMRRAGDAVARLALALAPHAERAWIAAGPGNNGGDGLEAALHLQHLGRRVAVTLCGDAARLPNDAADALSRAQAAGVQIGTALPEPLASHDIAIDALLGLGATRAPQGALADALHAFNAQTCTRLAIDVPSGLHADTGQPLGDDGARATATLALLTLKPGLFTGTGRDHAGAIWLDSLGVDAANEPPDAWTSGAGQAATAARRHAQHKGSFGDVAVVGGAAGMTGAALLAARAASAAGAGRVFVSLLDGAAAIAVDPWHPELMFRARWWLGDPAVLARCSVVCGCGGGSGEVIQPALARLLAFAGKLLLDADALNAIAADASLQSALTDRRHRGLATLLTPHPLEAARLLGCNTAGVQADRLGAARTLAERHQCAVVLKGSGSVIAAPGRVPHINTTGNASLASAGTGDVLAGWLGGLWAQETDPGVDAADDTDTSTDADTGARRTGAAFEVASRGVAAHGAAAEPERGGALRASDLVEALHRRIRGAHPLT